MYEEKTYANIMSEMMASAPDGIDTSEGSLLWNACSKMAAIVEGIYEGMADVYDNILCDTQDLDHLIASGGECGVPIIEATNAQFTAKFNLAVELGTRFEHTEQDLTYYVLALIDDTAHTYTVECEDEGSEANQYLGYIEPIEFLEGFETGELTELTASGEDQEDEDTYRYRRLNSFETRPFAGNRAYYKQEIGQIDGVGAVKVERVTSSQTTVKATILSAAYKAPTSALVAAVQAAVDPTSGDGSGIAPIGAQVTVYGATENTITVQVTITYKSGYSSASIDSYVKAAIDQYFAELGQEWADSDQLVVRRSQVENRIMDIEGVLDVTACTLNSQSGNVTLTAYQVPVRGAITYG